MQDDLQSVSADVVEAAMHELSLASALGVVATRSLSG